MGREIDEVRDPIRGRLCAGPPQGVPPKRLPVLGKGIGGHGQGRGPQEFVLRNVLGDKALFATVFQRAAEECQPLGDLAGESSGRRQPAQPLDAVAAAIPRLLGREPA